jgi:activator of HSP90 ATPase
MAKFGEGDPRWLVQKREDGTNVNGWHWVERDALEWSKRRLGQLFDGAVLVESPRVVATGLESLAGEAFLNNRKAKLVATYELRLVAGWRADGGADGGVPVTGTIELPYLADENADEDPEVKVATADESAAAAELRTALLRKGGREVRGGGGVVFWEGRGAKRRGISFAFGEPE